MKKTLIGLIAGGMLAVGVATGVSAQPGEITDAVWYWCDADRYWCESLTVEEKHEEKRRALEREHRDWQAEQYAIKTAPFPTPTPKTPAEQLWIEKHEKWGYRYNQKYAQWCLGEQGNLEDGIFVVNHCIGTP